MTHEWVQGMQRDGVNWTVLWTFFFHFGFSFPSCDAALNLCQVSHSFLTLNGKNVRTKVPEVKTNVVFTFLSQLNLYSDPTLSVINHLNTVRKFSIKITRIRNYVSILSDRNQTASASVFVSTRKVKKTQQHEIAQAIFVKFSAISMYWNALCLMANKNSSFFCSIPSDVDGARDREKWNNPLMKHTSFYCFKFVTLFFGVQTRE